MAIPQPGTPDHNALLLRFRHASRIRPRRGDTLTFERFALNPDAHEASARARIANWWTLPPQSPRTPRAPRLVLN
ncbi:MAG: hypothetical protein IAE99_08335 [Rhodothermales bacterium]|nr:hypothetical protein [Rhodothermales bacterium]